MKRTTNRFEFLLHIAIASYCASQPIFTYLLRLSFNFLRCHSSNSFLSAAILRHMPLLLVTGVLTMTSSRPIFSFHSNSLIFDTSMAFVANFSAIMFIFLTALGGPNVADFAYFELIGGFPYFNVHIGIILCGRGYRVEIY